MDDNNKTKAELVKELEKLRSLVSDMESKHHLTGKLEKGSSLQDIFGKFPTLKEVDDYMIADAMERSNGNQGAAAALLGITRQALNQRLKKRKA